MLQGQSIFILSVPPAWTFVELSRAKILRATLENDQRKRKYRRIATVDGIFIVVKITFWS